MFLSLYFKGENKEKMEEMKINENLYIIITKSIKKIKKWKSKRFKKACMYVFKEHYPVNDPYDNGLFESKMTDLMNKLSFFSKNNISIKEFVLLFDYNQKKLLITLLKKL